MTDYRRLTAPCGTDCFNCPVQEANFNEQIQTTIATRMSCDPNEIHPCLGCRDQGGCVLHADCETYDCVKQKNVEFCSDCDEFPCVHIQPLAEGAAIYPHNIKLFNLCRIKNVGIEKWAEEEAMLIKKRYYTGKFRIGSGPVMEDE